MKFRLKECDETSKDKLKVKLARILYVGSRFVINDQLVEGFFAYYPYFISVAKEKIYSGIKYERNSNEPPSEIEKLVD
jgi:hypothetical protein